MATFVRRLAIDLPAGRSAFLWGPRKVGKTTLLRERFPESITFDLLRTDVMLDFLRRPSLLRERLQAEDPRRLESPVILDEIQKVPALLDEVHWLIENTALRFILCGSSARKLKRGHGNLLGGRAWRYELFPLVTPELEDAGDIDLTRILNRGTIPAHYLQEQYRRSLDAYVQDYLKEEVFDEGLTRNQPAFSRFFDAIGPGHGELTNYANIARDCGIDAKTVKAYYQILVDTLLGRFVEPFSRGHGRQVIAKAAKFYLFDVGVAGFLARRGEVRAGSEPYGKAFEHFIFTELAAHSSYSGQRYEIRFWRTKSGLEVDFILGEGAVAIEAKASDRVDSRHLRPLRAFIEEHAPRAAFVVSNEPVERLVAGIRIVPWRDFLKNLWSGKITVD